MKEFEALQFEAEAMTMPLALDDTGRVCGRITVRNTGDKIVVIARVTVRVCMSIEVAGRRLRWCVPFSTSIEISGKTCGPLKVPAGEIVVFTACTELGNREKEKLQEFDSRDVEFEIHEIHDGIEFVRTLKLDDAETCEQ